jgi:hypothetical protein
VIPTGYKSEIPKTHSYPLGAKAISDSLAGVPQFDLLKINFSFGWKGFAKDRVPDAPYRVLEVNYYGPQHSVLSGWTIYVRPVPRARKHAIKSKLIAEALPKIKVWLEVNTHSLNREGSHGITFFFDELADELTTEEHSSAEWNTERV